jgi:hypothetical protein
LEKKNFLNLIQKYNLRINEDRLEDFRTTIKEIVDVNIHGQIPRDKKELDSAEYGRPKVEADIKSVQSST